MDADVKARRGMATRLVEAFGSTRRKRQLKAREEGTVRADKLLSGAAAEAALEAVNERAAEEGGTREEVIGRVTARRNIPPHDAAATEAAKAYPLRRLVPEDCLAALNIGQLLHASEKADVLEKVTEKRLVPQYVLSRLPLLRAASGDKERKERARWLALLSALLGLVNQPGAALRAPREGGLEALARKLHIGRREALEPLLDLFYHREVGGGPGGGPSSLTAPDGADGGVASPGGAGEVFVRDGPKKELQVLYTCVAALGADGWALAGPQFEALASELRMSLQDVATR